MDTLCHNQMLMCFLRVCPFIKPVGKNCIVEKREDQCCPTISCPPGKELLVVAPGQAASHLDTGIKQIVNCEYTPDIISSRKKLILLLLQQQLLLLIEKIPETS
jgi:hypothetical protein